jgi:hypothetical protein
LETGGFLRKLSKFLKNSCLEKHGETERQSCCGVWESQNEEVNVIMRGTEAVINFHESASSHLLFPDRKAEAYYNPNLKKKLTEKLTGYIRYVRLLISRQLTLKVINLSGHFRLIFSDAASRNIFMFLCLNLSFAFVELFYGIWSNR